MESVLPSNPLPALAPATPKAHRRGRDARGPAAALKPRGSDRREEARSFGAGRRGDEVAPVAAQGETAGAAPPAVGDWYDTETHPIICDEIARFDPWIKSRRLAATELSINEPGWLAIESIGRGYFREPVPWITLDWCLALCQRLANVAGREFTKRKPVLSATLPGGHRLMAMMGKNVLSGVSISIRVRRQVERTFADFNITPAQEAVLVDAMRRGLNVLVSGGTSTGKTSLLRLLCNLSLGALSQSRRERVSRHHPCQHTARRARRLALQRRVQSQREKRQRRGVDPRSGAAAGPDRPDRAHRRRSPRGDGDRGSEGAAVADPDWRRCWSPRRRRRG
jgi:hypothetical protein